MRKHEGEADQRDGVSSVEREHLEELEREVKELRKANEILKLASAFFCSGGAQPPIQVIRKFIDEHREVYGVEPLCMVLQIARRAICAMSHSKEIRSCCAHALSVMRWKCPLFAGFGKST